MAQIIVRQLPDEVHLALKTKAKCLGKSAEALAREILSNSVMPKSRIRLGDQLSGIWQGSDVSGLTFERDKTPYQPVSFE